MTFYMDPDEWETVCSHTPCRSCGGDLRKCNGMCTGSSSIEYRQRDPEQIALIKEVRRRDAFYRAAELLRSDPKLGRAALVELGIVDEGGNLTNLFAET